MMPPTRVLITLIRILACSKDELNTSYFTVLEVAVAKIIPLVTTVQSYFVSADSSIQLSLYEYKSAIDILR